MAFALSIRGVCAPRANARPGADSIRAERNAIWSAIVPADGTRAATEERENGDFGTSPIYGQLSDKPRLAFVC